MSAGDPGMHREVVVRGRGWTGRAAVGDLEAGEQVPVLVDGGPEIWVRRDWLVPKPDGSWEVPLELSAERVAASSAEPAKSPSLAGRVTGHAQSEPPGDVPPASSQREAHQEEVRVPIVTERLRVGKRLDPTGRVQVRKKVVVRDEVVEQPLLHEEVEVERVPRNEIVEAPLAPRFEADEIIIPLVEEVLVVEKRLVLREEVHLRRRRETRVHREVVPVSAEEVEIERLPEARGMDPGDMDRGESRGPEHRAQPGP